MTTVVYPTRAVCKAGYSIAIELHRYIPIMVQKDDGPRVQTVQIVLAKVDILQTGQLGSFDKNIFLNFPDLIRTEVEVGKTFKPIKDSVP